jgi:hypothetical protein
LIKQRWRNLLFDEPIFYARAAYPWAALEFVEEAIIFAVLVSLVTAKKSTRR